MRDGRPTQARQETPWPLEQGEAAPVWASAMAATGARLQSLPPGTHLVLAERAVLEPRAGRRIHHAAKP